MNTIKLTIAIPTYNRPEKIRSAVTCILGQLTGQTELIILDNASDIPVSEILANEIPNPNLRIIRNIANVGMQANVAKCFEFASGKWMWLLSDDDTPLAGAVATILGAIDESDPGTCCLNFSSCHGPRSESFKSRGCEEFMTKIDSFGNIIFFSVNVYHTNSLRNHLRYCYIYAYSQLGYLAMLMMSLSDRGVVYFRKEELVDYHAPPPNEKWSSVSLMLGLCTLLELPISASSRAFKIFHSHLLTLALPPKTLFRIALRAPAASTNWQERLIVEQCLVRSFLQFRGVISVFFKILFFRAILKIPHRFHAQIGRFLGETTSTTINTELGNGRLNRF